MALPASGPISFNDINVELGDAGTTQASLGQASYRGLAGVASGAISLSNFYGKSSQFSFNITTANNVNFRTAAVAAGWDQSSLVVGTIPSGNTIGSTSTASPALVIAGSFPSGVTLINNGAVRGMGGAGGNGLGPTSGSTSYENINTAGGSGGNALSVSVPTTVQNNGTLAGGGGGGGGGGGTRLRYPAGKGFLYELDSGAGGGGGAGSNGGAGGLGRTSNNRGAPAAGNGGTGTATSGGAGGAATQVYFCPGGAGGGPGAAGSAGSSASPNGQTAYISGAAGGIAGSYIVGNPFVLWTANGTRQGTVS